MKFKSLLALLAGLMVLFACDNKPKNAYLIEGTVADSTLNGKTIYVQAHREQIDSAIITDGKFKFEGVVDTAFVAQIGMGRSQAFFVLEAGNISYDLAEGKAVGTPLNETLNGYLSQIEELQKAYIAGMNEAQETQDQEKAEAAQNTFFDALDALQKEAFTANTNNGIGAFFLSNMLADASSEDADAYLAQAGDIVKADKDIIKLVSRMENIKATAEGKPFVDFTIENEDGTKASLSDYVGKGKYVLVDFWASWCGPCRGEIPNLKNIYEKYKNKNFEILGVAVWDKIEDTQKAIEEEGMTWPQIINAQSIPTDLYGISGIPAIMLFGPDGTIISRSLRGEEIGKKLEEVL